MIRSRYSTLGATALLFSTSILTFNFTNEYFALNREIPLTETPSFNSMMNRTGVAASYPEDYATYLCWSGFLERQFHRIGATLLPYAFSPSSYEELLNAEHNIGKLRCDYSSYWE